MENNNFINNQLHSRNLYSFFAELLVLRGMSGHFTISKGIINQSWSNRTFDICGCIFSTRLPTTAPSSTLCHCLLPPHHYQSSAAATPMSPYLPQITSEVYVRSRSRSKPVYLFLDK
ncbi:hypothetical protein Ahy_B08g091220 isoform E [Arachis hypogaea]|uniref:Uncharacterized protein n=1 Tax=Arachis hypogaea TaxID=3818 RepID=A0A444Y1P8_ARAHY|nr:hypothetical protein Ahy_B08g091220 isoform E [Arachis hypogaea]